MMVTPQLPPGQLGPLFVIPGDELRPEALTRDSGEVQPIGFTIDVSADNTTFISIHEELVQGPVGILRQEYRGIVNCCVLRILLGGFLHDSVDELLSL
jgi:hypothetical protein